MNFDALKTFQEMHNLVNEHAQEILGSFPFKIIHIRRTYNDGSSIWMTNHDSYLTEYFEKQLPLPRASYHYATYGNPTSGVYLWEEALPIMMKSFLEESHGIGQGVSLYQYHRDYCEVMAFALPSHMQVNSFIYFSNITPLLWKFRNHWFESNKLLLNNLNQKKLTFKPEAFCLETVDSIKMLEKKAFILKTQDKIYKINSHDALTIKMIQNALTLGEMCEVLKESLPHLNNNLDYLKKKIGQPFYDFSKFSLVAFD